MKRKVLPLLLLTAFFFGFAAARVDHSITAALVEQAGRLIGLEFKSDQHEMMIRSLEMNRNAYEEIRSFELNNAVAPALVFDPLPAGYQPPIPRGAIQWDIPEDIPLPADRNELAFYSIPELASLIYSRKISSEELTQFFIERLEQYGDTLEAVVSLTSETALAQARHADRELAMGRYRGPLHGIPYGAKDLLAVEGYKTTWGAMPYKDQQIEHTSTVIRKLDEAGAILVAKLTLGALAMGDIWFGGVTKNPWNLEQGSSGSSAGAASTVSAGLLPFAIGTETLGSIVSPSTRCGTTGLRPTFGRVSRDGAMALSWSMDKIGPIARSAYDCAIVLEAIAGKDRGDVTTVDAAYDVPPRADLSNFKVGYIKAFFDETYPGKENDQQVLADLQQMGIELEEVEWDFSVPVSALRIILTAEAAAAFDELTVSGRDSLLVAQGANAWPNTFRVARFPPAVEYINANRLRKILVEEVYALMKEYDVIVTPSYGGSQLLVTNLTGNPCLVAPNGFNASGSPTSISFIGNLFEEGKLVTLASAWQDYSGHHQKHPPLFK
ncbi:MAG: amidase [Bacteroides sp.]|jgi:Asp-tRNA(Asn)/Glu-tRNA(Gln) amidotransferase A subunit family amidase|nr:amidase [Bacteroides sp.]